MYGRRKAILLASTALGAFQRRIGIAHTTRLRSRVYGCDRARVLLTATWWYLSGGMRSVIVGT